MRAEGIARLDTEAPRSPFRCRLLGVEVDALTVDDLHRMIDRAVRHGTTTVIAHLNLHGAYLHAREPAMKELLADADAVHIDGMALVAWGRLLGHPLRRAHRITYMDWVDPLMAEATARGWRVFYLGSRPGVAEKGAAVLRNRHPGLQIVTRHGFFDACKASAENAEVLAEIARYRPHVLMVGMGMPRQERWILENRDALAAHAILPCGACMDYVAGALSSPPRWMGRVGLEWLFRLVSEPRRLARRYLVEPWHLAGRMLEDVRERVAGRASRPGGDRPLATRIRRAAKKNIVVLRTYRFLRRIYLKHCFTDRSFIRRQNRKELGREVVLENPVRYNDKLQWLKLNWFDPLAARCADKYEVRSYVSDTIGSGVLTEIHGLYERVEDIDVSALPERFVLKATHASGLNLLCRDKAEIDWKRASRTMRTWLNYNYFWGSREWVYRDLVPRILCEEFLAEPGGAPLLDYRFFCFNGTPRFIAVDFDINDKARTRRNLYDLDWTLMDEEITYPRELGVPLPRPSGLSEMIAMAGSLSAPFPHVRVDFYFTGGRIRFGEMTFFHQSGVGEFRPEAFEFRAGKWLELSEVDPGSAVREGG